MSAIATGQIIIIGDSHIGLADGDERPIVEWIDRLTEFRPRALYLNGDVFHYLIGDRKFFTSSVHRFFERLRALRDSGTEVFYVEGNRDFFLQGTLAEESVSHLGIQFRIEAGSKRYLIIHGDMINDRDLPYRFWRRFSKNPVMRFGVKLVPGPVARRFVHNVEKKLAGTNFKHKYRLPVEIMERYGRQQAERGYDTIVFGHFHHKTLVAAGEATVVVLPAWYESGEAMVVNPETGEFDFREL
jgi:UDP-2,3-diacylglucosamine hydrolase